MVQPADARANRQIGSQQLRDFRFSRNIIRTQVAQVFRLGLCLQLRRSQETLELRIHRGPDGCVLRRDRAAANQVAAPRPMAIYGNPFNNI